MKTFPVREVAQKFAKQFGGTDGCEEKAYIEGAKAALEYAMMQCHSGATPGMIRFVLSRKLDEANGKDSQ